MASQSQGYSLSFYSDLIDPALDPEPLSSQPTAPTSISLTDYQQLPRPSSCTEIIKDWVLYTEMNKDDFVKWWLTTSYGSELSEKNS
jgi:hypothetical protein